MIDRRMNKQNGKEKNNKEKAIEYKTKCETPKNEQRKQNKRGKGYKKKQRWNESDKKKSKKKITNDRQKR